MKKIFLALVLALVSVSAKADEIFYYSPSDGNGGLRFAVHENGKWQSLANGYDFVKSDFGAWGSHKKMWNPALYPTEAGWTLVFDALPDGSVKGLAETNDITRWKPQRYIAAADTASLSFIGNHTARKATVAIDGKDIEGRIMDVDSSFIKRLSDFTAERQRLAELYSEHCDGDSLRFAGLTKLNATLKANGRSKAISPLLMGIFFEDINYAADGGLYAELVQNRDFEYDPSESGRKGWGPRYAWSTTGDGISFDIATEAPIHPNNPHFARLTADGNGSAFINSGFDGIALKNGEQYKLRIKARSEKKMPLIVSLVSDKGEIAAFGKISIEPSHTWKDYTLTLKAEQDSPAGTLQLIPSAKGTIDLDMVSLFPVNTFKGRENGLRADLAQALADLHPRFVRFPGGCVAHGNGLDNVYDWKGSIGPLEARKPLYNLWGYHQTRGLGYHEYFLFCEDIGAEPLPVVAAGVPCQNSSRKSRFTRDELTHHGQQCGLPLDSLDAYIQDILDLIEYANGPATSRWGALRAAAGHPEPFNLKYIGIGNEDMITEVFEERFTRINAAVKAAHPEITVIGTVGPFYEGPDYDEGWRIARENKLDMVDEHYYVDPAWLIYNQDFYDSYDRNGTKVYLGEWAAHLPGRPSNIETALAEALYLTAVERNGDVVSMSSYAPLLAKTGHTQWKPDLIYFTNTDVRPTTDYTTMRLFGEHGGNEYFESSLNVDSDNDKARVRVGASIVRDNATGDYVLKLVNMLPVEVTVDIDLSSLPTKVSSGERHVFKGKPTDTASPVSSSNANFDSPAFVETIAPYSFTVLRMR